MRSRSNLLPSTQRIEMQFDSGAQSRLLARPVNCSTNANRASENALDPCTGTLNPIRVFRIMTMIMRHLLTMLPLGMTMVRLQAPNGVLARKSEK